jgi:hypothetical protein
MQRVRVEREPGLDEALAFGLAPKLQAFRAHKNAPRANTRCIILSP